MRRSVWSASARDDRARTAGVDRAMSWRRRYDALCTKPTNEEIKPLGVSVVVPS